MLQIRLNFIVDRTSGTDKKPQYLSRWKGAVSRKTYTGADVDWYVKAEDIVLKNKGNQNAGSPQNHTPQGQPKK